MLRRSLAVGLVGVVCAIGGTIILASDSITGHMVNGFKCTATVTSGMGAGAIAGAIVSAANGSTVCLASGSYPFIHVMGAAHTAYVTVRPAAGATATVAGMEVQDSSFLRFQGLHMTEGFNMRDDSTAASHDYQFIENTLEEPLYGFVLYGGSGPMKKVLIEKNYVHHVHLEKPESGGKCEAGYAQGQDVTLDYAEGVTISHNTFKQAEWHYIQGGGAGPEGVTVEHNLFEGRVFYPCSHLNVWQIWDGGENDTFRDNIVKAEAGQFASIIALIFENGSGGGGECADAVKNSVVENNLFGERTAESYTTEFYQQKGFVYTHNTFLGGGQYGTYLDRSDWCGATESSTIEHNITVGMTSTGAPQRFIVGECKGTCKFDYNVSDDETAGQLGSTHYVANWSPKWTTTSWNQATETSPPAGYYQPVGLPFAAGYEGGGGP